MFPFSRPSPKPDGCARRCPYRRVAGAFVIALPMLLSACHYPYAAPARPAVTVYDGGVYYAPYRSYGYSHGYAYRHYRYYRYYDRHRHHSFHSHGHY